MLNKILDGASTVAAVVVVIGFVLLVFAVTPFILMVLLGVLGFHVAFLKVSAAVIILAIVGQIVFKR